MDAKRLAILLSVHAVELEILSFLRLGQRRRQVDLRIGFLGSLSDEGLHKNH